MGIILYGSDISNMLGCCPYIDSATRLTLTCCSLMFMVPYATYNYARDTKDTAKRHLRWKRHDLDDLLRRTNQTGIN